MQTSTAISRSAAAALTDGGTAKDRQVLPSVATKRFDAILHVIEIVLRDMPNADPATRVALARLTEALARIVDFPPQPQESLRDFTRRLAGHMDVLPPAARALIEKQLNQQPLLAALKMLVETLRPALTIDLRIDMPLTRDGLWHPDAVSALFPDEDDRPAFRQPTIQAPLPTRMAFSQAPGVAPNAPHLQQALGQAFSPEATTPPLARPDPASDARSAAAAPAPESTGRPIQTAEDPVPTLRSATAFLASDAQALAQAVAIARGQALDTLSDGPPDPVVPRDAGTDASDGAGDGVGAGAHVASGPSEGEGDVRGDRYGEPHDVRRPAERTPAMTTPGKVSVGSGATALASPVTRATAGGEAATGGVRNDPLFSQEDHPERRLAGRPSMGTAPDHAPAPRAPAPLVQPLPAQSSPERAAPERSGSESLPGAARSPSETITFQARPLAAPLSSLDAVSVSPADRGLQPSQRPGRSGDVALAHREPDSGEPSARRLEPLLPQVEIALMTSGLREVANTIGQLDEWETLFYMLSGSLGETSEALLPQEARGPANPSAESANARPQSHPSIEADLLTVMDEDRATLGLAQMTQSEDVVAVPLPPRGLEASILREAVGFPFVPYLNAPEAGSTEIEDDEPRRHRGQDEAGFAQSGEDESRENDDGSSWDEEEAEPAEASPRSALQAGAGQAGAGQAEAGQAEAGQAEAGHPETTEAADGARHDAYDLYQRLSDLA
ncbi:hypothetical protein ASG39_09270 [Rhizobium sp. Leaf371]|uniref:hypothetical protein n=1 Tax=Rhizobium sp. Leaf371 TaxID=1736355 RepID=UPI000713FFE0|nr:hypothetical protein [Rhizobium sp. Leaf371]KQS65415.1 hypothetical protein ASG39_09270 [Rhizobium sp. Leaf371]